MFELYAHVHGFIDRPYNCHDAFQLNLATDRLETLFPKHSSIMNRVKHLHKQTTGFPHKVVRFYAVNISIQCKGISGRSVAEILISQGFWSGGPNFLLVLVRGTIHSEMLR